jgi:oligopeptide transport system ATP-binding protein
MAALLEVKNLKTHFRTKDGVVKAVDDVSFTINKGETLGVVGESGSGKSVTAMSIMRLVQHPGKIVGGEILFDGRDLVKMNEKDMRKVRGKDIGMIFQDPMTSLNPVLNIGRQLSEPLIEHMSLTKEQALKESADLLKMVGIPNAVERLKSYPHHFSGGMRQRVMIAMALACRPKLIIADEPTTALDVTIQAQILELMKRLQNETGCAVLIITHALGVVAGMADRINVMYAGHVVETATADELFENPRMPYTLGLMRSIPRLDEEKRDRLHPIQGSPPDMLDLPQGCPFVARCDYSFEPCPTTIPLLRKVPSESGSELPHLIACHAEVHLGDPPTNPKFSEADVDVEEAAV